MVTTAARSNFARVTPSAGLPPWEPPRPPRDRFRNAFSHPHVYRPSFFTIFREDTSICVNHDGLWLTTSPVPTAKARVNVHACTCLFDSIVSLASGFAAASPSIRRVSCFLCRPHDLSTWPLSMPCEHATAAKHSSQTAMVCCKPTLGRAASLVAAHHCCWRCHLRLIQSQRMGHHLACSQAACAL